MPPIVSQQVQQGTTQPLAGLAHQLCFGLGVDAGSRAGQGLATVELQGGPGGLLVFGSLKMA